MKLIAGLGNPGDKYEKTFHNMGFLAVEALSQALEIKFKTKESKSLTAQKFINGEKIIIAKPQTYMNLSGEAIRELMGVYRLESSDIIIIYDDLDLERAQLRIRSSGSAGTHNGMRNIVACIGSTDFARIRIGIGKPPVPEMPVADYVLSEIPKPDYEKMFSAIIRAKDAALDFASGTSIEKIMQKYNGQA